MFARRISGAFLIRLSAVVLLAAGAGRASADVVTNLSTGFDNATGTLLAPFTVDAKYQVLGPGGVTVFPQARDATGVPGSYIGDAALPGSRWDYLTLTATSRNPDFVPSGNYDFRTTVDLTGFDSATASIRNLQVATDNFFLSVAVNGTTVLSRSLPGGVVEEFGSVLTLPADLGLGAFHSGLNTIDLTIFNQGFGGGTSDSPGAFRASGTVQATPVGSSGGGGAGIPEPSTLALLGLGALGLFGYRWRRGSPGAAR
jgi:hypothetical protein